MAQTQQKLISYSDFKMGVADSLLEVVLKPHLQHVAPRVITPLNVKPVEGETRNEESTFLPVTSVDSPELPCLLKSRNIERRNKSVAVSPSES